MWWNEEGDIVSVRIAVGVINVNESYGLIRHVYRLVLSYHHERSF